MRSVHLDEALPGGKEGNSGGREERIGDDPIAVNAFP